MTVPANGMKRITIDLPVELADALKSYCFHNNVTRAQLLRDVISQIVSTARKSKENT